MLTKQVFKYRVLYYRVYILDYVVSLFPSVTLVLFPHDRCDYFYSTEEKNLSVIFLNVHVNFFLLRSVNG